MVLPEPAEIEGAVVPPVKEYLKAAQKNGKDLCAEEVYRWIQCEEAISEFGFLAKHPTTGNAIASPYVAMSQTYMKQVNQVWYQIYQIVKENCAVEYGGRNPQDDLMERLLTARKGN